MNRLDDIRNDFSKKLNKLVEKSDLSISSLCKKIGIDRSSFYKYLKGETSPRIDVFVAICDCFDVEPNYFIGKSVCKTVRDKDEESAARGVIESMFYLFQMGYIQKIPQDIINPIYKLDYPVEYCINPNLTFCEKNVLHEISLYSKSLFSDKLSVCETIVNGFEEAVDKAIKERLNIEK